MKIKFKDGTVKTCTNPIEQKMYRNGLEAGWVLMFNIVDTITSNDADKLLHSDNIDSLVFVSDAYDEDAVSKTITGYNGVNYVIIKYSDDVNAIAEIQLQKTSNYVSNETE